MRKALPLAAAVTMTLALGGPAQSQGQAAAPSATFVFKKSYDRGVGIGRGTAQQYYHLPAGTCRGRKRQARFSWITGAQKQQSLPAGRPLTLWMITQHFTYGAVDQCHNAMTFTPRPGATYEVALRSFVGSHCEISVVDRETGAAPEGLAYDKSIDCT